MAEREAGRDSLSVATELARAAESKLASEVVILDMRGLVSYTDFLVICSARNERQADSIVGETYQVMKHEYGLLPVNPARGSETDWTVLDYLDVVMHVFTGEARTTYDLEDLWFEAPRVEFDSATTGESGDGQPVAD